MPDADPTQIMRRTSRVMQTDDDRTKSYRRVIKKPIVKSGSSRSTQNLQVSLYIKHQPYALETISYINK